MVDVPAPGAAIDEGLKLKLRWLCEPPAVADREIAESKPLETVVVIVLVALAACVTETVAGAAMVNPVTVRVTVAVCEMPPPVPVTVIG
jgi:hypothetical protein